MKQGLALLLTLAFTCLCACAEKPPVPTGEPSVPTEPPSQTESAPVELPEVCTCYSELETAETVYAFSSSRPFAESYLSGTPESLYAVKNGELDEIATSAANTEARTLEEVLGGAVQRISGEGETCLHWQESAYLCYSLTIENAALPGLVAPTGGILALEVHGDCSMDPGDPEWAALSGFDCVILSGDGTLRLVGGLEAGGKELPALILNGATLLCDNVQADGTLLLFAGTLGTALETIPYSYGDSNWKDKLTAYNGQAITYDAIGNPLNDGTWTYSWEAGRRLAQMSKSGTTVQYQYDANGLRVGKIANGTETTYTLHGKLLTHLKHGANEMHFYYDAQSRPAMVNFNGAYYMYLHNLQGDVVGLVDNSNNLVVEYKYDAWGRPTLKRSLTTAYDTLATLNPFRYRGYVYDEETGLYYVSSRYYDPEIGRWISADNAETLTVDFENFAQYNLFAYCHNNATNMLDNTGFWPGRSDLATKLAIGVIVS